MPSVKNYKGSENLPSCSLTSIKINNKDFNQDKNWEGLSREHSRSMSVLKALQEKL